MLIFIIFELLSQVNCGLSQLAYLQSFKQSSFTIFKLYSLAINLFLTFPEVFARLPCIFSQLSISSLRHSL